MEDENNLFPEYQDKRAKPEVSRFNKIVKRIIIGFSILFLIFLLLSLLIIGFIITNFKFSIGGCDSEIILEDNEAAELIGKDATGNYYVVGRTNSLDFPMLTQNYNQSDGFYQYYYITKFLPDGVIEWSYFINDSDITSINNIIFDDSNNILLSGSARSRNPSPNTGILLKISTSAKLQWIYEFDKWGDDKLILGKNNSIYLVYTDRYNDGENLVEDVYINYFTSSGDLIWVKQYVNAQLNPKADPYVDSSSNLIIYFIQKVSYDQDEIYTPFLTKISAEGEVIWQLEFGRLLVDGGVHRVVSDNEGNTYIIGKSFIEIPEMQNPIIPKSADRDIFIMKYDGIGNMMWSTYLGGDSNEFVVSSLLLGNNQLLLTILVDSTDFPSNSSSTNGGLFLVQISTDGSIAQTIDTSSFLNSNVASSQGTAFVSFDNEKVVFVINLESQNNGKGDISLVTINLLNHEITIVDIGGSDIDIQSDVLSDNQGSIVVVGESRSLDFPIINNQDIALQGSVDAFIMQVDENQEIIWSRTFGGNGGNVTYMTCD